MKLVPDKNRPLCPQICEHICSLIVSGKLIPDQKLMSVREMAISTGVNPNTIQRSFEMLYNDGLLYSVPGSGWYVSNDISKAKEKLNKTIFEKTKKYFGEMKALGLNPEEIKNYIKEWENE